LCDREEKPKSYLTRVSAFDTAVILDPGGHRDPDLAVNQVDDGDSGILNLT